MTTAATAIVFHHVPFRGLCTMAIPNSTRATMWTAANGRPRINHDTMREA